MVAVSPSFPPLSLERCTHIGLLFTAVETIIFYNLPTGSKLVAAVQFMYSTAIILSAPLQLFPAIRIIEVRFPLFFKSRQLLG